MYLENNKLILQFNQEYVKKTRISMGYLIISVFLSGLLSYLFLSSQTMAMSFDFYLINKYPETKMYEMLFLQKIFLKIFHTMPQPCHN